MNEEDLYEQVRSDFQGTVKWEKQIAKECL